MVATERRRKQAMGRPITENPRILADKEELEKKRKSHNEMSEYCVVMGSSNSKEQQLLEAAAFHLILLSNPRQQSYDHYTKLGYDNIDGCYGNNGSLGGGFRVITSKKKRKQDYGGESIVKHNNDNEENSATSSSSSAETIKSGISGHVSMEEEKEVDHNDRRTTRRLQEHRWRSILDIYDVTRPL